MNFDIHFSYTIKNEETSTTGQYTKETTTINKRAIKLQQSEIKTKIREFVDSLPDNVISSELWVTEHWEESFDKTVQSY